MFVNLRCITTSGIEVLSDWEGGVGKYNGCTEFGTHRLAAWLLSRDITDKDRFTSAALNVSIAFELNL